jgi:hypothetical protein
MDGHAELDACGGEERGEESMLRAWLSLAYEPSVGSRVEWFDMRRRDEEVQS